MNVYLQIGYLIIEAEVDETFDEGNLFRIFKTHNTFYEFAVECDINNINCKITEDDFDRIKNELECYPWIIKLQNEVRSSEKVNK